MSFSALPNFAIWQELPNALGIICAFCGKSVAQKWFAMAGAASHLEYLKTEGKVRRIGQDGLRKYYSAAAPTGASIRCSECGLL